LNDNYNTTRSQICILEQFVSFFSFNARIVYSRALTGLSDAKGVEEEAEISPEEATHRRAIEQEKTVYRESFDKLRVLKPEIEHIRKVEWANFLNTDQCMDGWMD
jgi:hypothetical protein